MGGGNQLKAGDNFSVQNKNQNSLTSPNRPQVPNTKNPLQSSVPYNSGKNVQFLEPEIFEKRNWELKHASFAVILAFVLVLAQFGLMTLLELEVTGSWILAFVLIVIFGAVIYFLLEPRKEREIRQKIVETNLQTIDRPVVREVTRTIEVEKPVVREVPVYREPRTVYGAKFIEKHSVKRTPSLKYDFVGSKLTRTYHKSSCRLGKSIERKYHIKAPTRSYFKRMRYKPCKVCRPNK